MIGAPLDICRSFMLKENKRLYAMVICTIASLKCIFQAMCFYRTNKFIIKNKIDYFYQILLILLVNFVSACMIITIVRDEVGEI